MIVCLSVNRYLVNYCQSTQSCKIKGKIRFRFSTTNKGFTSVGYHTVSTLQMEIQSYPLSLSQYFVVHFLQLYLLFKQSLTLNNHKQTNAGNGNNLKIRADVFEIGLLTLSLSLTFSVCLTLSQSLSISIYLSISLYWYLSLTLSIYLSLSPFLCAFVIWKFALVLCVLPWVRVWG